MFVFSILLQNVTALYILKKMVCLKIKQYHFLLFSLVYPFIVVIVIFLVELTTMMFILCELLMCLLVLLVAFNQNVGVSLFYTVFTLSYTFYIKEFVASFIMKGIFGIHQDMVATVIGYASAILIYYLLKKYMAITPGQFIISEQVSDKHQSEMITLDKSVVQARDFEKEQHRLIIVSNIVMLCCYMFCNYVTLTKYNHELNVNGFVFSCILLFIFILYLMHVKFREWENQELLRCKHYLILGLTTYIQEVEKAYQSVRAFHHDFTNILLSMQETISTKEVGEIRKMYAEILEQRHIIFVEQRQEIAKLKNVKILEIKSVIAAKILQADMHDISVELEITEVLSEVAVDKLDMVRLLGIMLDNAIDEALELAGTKPVVRLAIFDKGESKYFVVENSMRQEKLPTHLILERGYSTKGNTRGHGLANLETIVSNYPWVSYHIQAKNYRYRIELEMRQS